MHCVTEAFDPRGDLTSDPVKSPMGAVYGASATGKLKRSEWGLTGTRR